MGLTHRASGDKRYFTTCDDNREITARDYLVTNMQEHNQPGEDRVGRVNLAPSMRGSSPAPAHLEQCAKLDAAYAAVLLLEHVS